MNDETMAQRLAALEEIVRRRDAQWHEARGVYQGMLADRRVPGEHVRLLAHVLASDVPAAPTATCTGLGATWCPVHGDCTCTDRDADEPLPDYHCPLHGMGSQHADQPV